MSDGDFEFHLRALIRAATSRHEYTYPEIADMRIEAAAKSLRQLYRASKGRSTEAMRRRWQEKTFDSVTLHTEKPE